MKDRNAYDRFDFVFNHILWIWISWLAYKSYLFRCIGSLSSTKSMLILLGIVVPMGVGGMLANMEHRRNVWSIIFDLALPYGIYTAITYMQIRGTLIRVCLIVAAALSIAYAIILMTRRIKRKKRKGIIIRRRIWNILNISARIFGVCLAVIMLSFGVNLFFGTSVMKSTKGALAKIDDREQMLNDNMETVCMLQDEKWNELGAQERLNVLQTVADIEQMLLGIPNELNVGTANLRTNVLGYYLDGTHEILIDMDVLLEGESWDAVETLCHEVFHGYQKRLVDLLTEVDESKRSLYIFNKANIYAHEFSNYKSGKYDIDAYIEQLCESDAGIYGLAARYDYYDKVMEYVEGNADGT